MGNYFLSTTRKHKIYVLLADVLTMLSAAIALGEYYYARPNGLLSIGWPAIVLVFLYIAGHYRLMERINVTRLIIYIPATIVLASFLVYPLLNGPDRMRVVLLFGLVVTTSAALILNRIVVSHLRNMTRRPRIAVLITSKAAERRIKEIELTLEHAYVFLGVIVVEPDNKERDKELAAAFSKKPEVIVYEQPVVERAWLAETLFVQKLKGAVVVEVAEFYSELTGKLPLELVEYKWFLRDGRRQLRGFADARLKRVVDLVSGIVMGTMLAVPMLLIALVIRLESRGPIIFRQERLGFHRKPFVLYKFRSMVPDAEKDGPKWATRNDARVMRIGGFLRRTHLDELPQIFNLLKGDMSLVGPRPIRAYFADHFATRFPFYNVRYLVKPGLTGWAQVIGPYGENMKEEREKLEMDLYFIHNSGILRDIYIVLRTGQCLNLLPSPSLT